MVSLDHSRLDIDAGMTFGTLGQILSSTESAGKTLAAVNVPAPTSVSPFLALATDAYAWDMTIDLPWCHRKWEMPRSDLRWAEIFTRSVCGPIKSATNGFATHIEVKASSQFLVVCRPDLTPSDAIMSFSWLKQFQKPYSMDGQKAKLQGYRLEPGTVV